MAEILMPATVDSDLFSGLEAAIAFVASCGGGKVRTAEWDTLWAKSLKLPEGVKLAPLAEAAQAEQ